MGIPEIPNTLCESCLVTRKAIQYHHHNFKNNISKLPNEPLGSTKIVQWEQLALPFRPYPTHSTHRHTLSSGMALSVSGEDRL